MSIIEEAAQRLEQLRKAGVEVPTPGADSAADTQRRRRGGRAHSNARTARAGARGVAHRPVAGDDAHRSPRFLRPLPRSAAETGRRSKVVQIDLEALAAAGFVTPEAQRSQIADEFRVLKRPIIKNAQGRSGPKRRARQSGDGDERTSPRGQEFRLAQSRDEHRVGSRQHGASGRRRRGEPVADEAIASPGIEGPARPADRRRHRTCRRPAQDQRARSCRCCRQALPHRRATEMLASTAMANLVDEMASRYPDRILVFDSPPLLATTEARVLASHMGQIVMVVEADQHHAVGGKAGAGDDRELPGRADGAEQGRAVGESAATTAIGYGAGYGAATSRAPPDRGIESGGQATSMAVGPRVLAAARALVAGAEVAPLLAVARRIGCLRGHARVLRRTGERAPPRALTETYTSNVELCARRADDQRFRHLALGAGFNISGEGARVQLNGSIAGILAALRQ